MLQPHCVVSIATKTPFFSSCKYRFLSSHKYVFFFYHSADVLNAEPILFLWNTNVSAHLRKDKHNHHLYIYGLYLCLSQTRFVLERNKFVAMWPHMYKENVLFCIYYLHDDRHQQPTMTAPQNAKKKTTFVIHKIGSLYEVSLFPSVRGT